MALNYCTPFFVWWIPKIPNISPLPFLSQANPIHFSPNLHDYLLLLCSGGGVHPTSTHYRHHTQTPLSHSNTTTTTITQHHTKPIIMPPPPRASICPMNFHAAPNPPSCHITLITSPLYNSRLSNTSYKCITYCSIYDTYKCITN